MPSMKRFGSYPGFETKASIPPVAGSIATSAPRFSPKARSTASCRPMSRVSTRLFPGRGAVQLALVALLQSRFPGVVGTLVVGGLIHLLDTLDVVVVYPADVTHDVRGDLSEGILPEQPSLDIHAGKTVAVDCELRDLFVGKAAAYRQVVEPLALLT